ncbi:MAG: penicillin-binding protein 2, partial [Proteobacteria bacterium]|nr:penicillin-binding protein 2 [Pseudomonadota bacterium]
MTDVSDGEERGRGDQFTRRSLLLGGVQAAGLGLVGWRVFDLQVIGARRYGPLAEDNRINLQVLAPKRGRIFDAY